MRIVALAPAKLNEGGRLACGAAALLLVLARVYPFERYPLVHCPMKELLHIPCPACGMTRAFVRFVHADWASALHVSPLGTILAAIAATMAVYGCLRLTVLRHGYAVQLARWEGTIWRIGIVAAVLSNWVYLIVSGAAA